MPEQQPIPHFDIWTASYYQVTKRFTLRIRMTDTALKTADLGGIIRSLTEIPRTELAKFVNQTSGWTVGYWLYEARQKANLPPHAGFEAYTGIVVGGQDVRPGQEQVAMLNVKVQANFMDCGAWKLRHSSGRTQETLNFADRLAPAGKFWLRQTFTLVDSPKFSESAIGWEFEGLCNDGTIERAEGVILSTL